MEFATFFFVALQLDFAKVSFNNLYYCEDDITPVLSLHFGVLQVHCKTMPCEAKIPFSFCPVRDKREPIFSIKSQEIN